MRLRRDTVDQAIKPLRQIIHTAIESGRAVIIDSVGLFIIAVEESGYLQGCWRNFSDQIERVANRSICTHIISLKLSFSSHGKPAMPTLLHLHVYRRNWYLDPPLCGSVTYW